MIRKTTLTFLHFLFFFGTILCTEMNSYAQTKAINPQVLPFDRICAGPDGNEYNATFVYSGFPAATVFVVELSTDNFTTIVGTTTLGVLDPAANQKTIKFAVPSNLKGSDTYALRVSTTGFSSGKFVSFGLKNAFPVYYKAHDRQYTINNFTGTATFCAGGSYLLNIDPDSTTPPNDSPLKYNFLTYNWYRDNGVSTPPTLVAGASGPSYNVTAEGVYYVETNYGTCTSESYSNRVTVTSSGSGGSAVTISSSLGNPFCSNGLGTVLTATSGNKYQWFKDGNKIDGATNRSYSTNESGKFSVIVDFGGCSASGDIDLKSNSFNAALDVPDNNVIGEGETLNVSVTTDAGSPTYEWLFNDTVIAGATTNSYLVTVKGNYKVKVSQSSGCVVTKELTFKVTSSASSIATVIPNIISLSSYPYWDLPSEYQNPNTKVIILSSQGEIVFQGVDYDSSKWVIKDFKNANPVYYYVIQSDTGEKKGSITVIK
jgi:hypothetical protein